MESIDNKMALELLATDIYTASLNLMYQNSITKNYLVWENEAKMLIRATSQKQIITLAVAFFNEYDRKYLQYIEKVINEIYNTNSIVTIQFYNGDSLIDEFKSLGFEVDLVLRDHVRINNEFYTIVSLSKGGKNCAGDQKYR